MVHTKSNDCYTNVFGCEPQVNIILLEFRSGWLSVSSSPIALASSSKIITDRDFRDLSFERISFLLYLCSNRRSPSGLRELKLITSLSLYAVAKVAAQVGCVNWNFYICVTRVWFSIVAAQVGCVNWNLSLVVWLWHACRSQPKWAAWIETFIPSVLLFISWSQPKWAAWIETLCLI